MTTQNVRFLNFNYPSFDDVKLKFLNPNIMGGGGKLQAVFLLLFTNGCCHRKLDIAGNAIEMRLLLSLVSITQQMLRPRHKNKAIIGLSSHPSR